MPGFDGVFLELFATALKGVIRNDERTTEHINVTFAVSLSQYAPGKLVCDHESFD